MIKKILLIASMVLATAWGVQAQCTSSPKLLQETSENVVIYYHADQGNLGLINQPASAELYAHTGVITNKSTSLSDWKHAPTWGTNTAKYKLEYVSPNLWKLNIGNIRTYYDLAADETVEKLAFVFRAADNSAEGKTSANGDIFLDVYPAGFQLALDSSLGTQTIVNRGTKVHFTVAVTNTSDLSLLVNDQSVASAAGTTELETDYTFNTEGDFTITAKAVYNGETYTKTLQYVVPKSSPAVNYPGGVPKMGAIANADGSVTFCLAAPQKTTAMIVGSWNNYETTESNTMNYQDYNGDRYFWITVPGVADGKDYIYYYVVDGKTKCGDPYARLVLDPQNDAYISSSIYPNLPAYPFSKVTGVTLAVYNSNFDNYNWQVTNFQRPSRDNLVIYELLIRDFTGTEGKALGDGTVRKAMEKLDYLQNMGINCIELLPINEFNGNISWGYNPNYYFAIDKAYGTPDDYRAFIDECHKRGIAVVLDMVFNQSDWQHPWYQLYGGTANNPFYNQTAPHAYSVLNDWNQGYPLVQQQWEDVIRYWLTAYKVDGFRFDLVKGLGDNGSYANSGSSATEAYNASRVQRMKKLNAVIQATAPGAYCINENLASAREENEMAADGELNWANVNHQGSQFAIGSQSDSSLERFYAPRDSRTWGSTVSYLESHDEQRLAYLQNTNGVSGVRNNLTVCMQRLSSAAAQMIMCPGSHMIWQFSELGNYDSTKASNGSNNVDPKTVRWNLLDNKNRRGLYECYSRLIKLRLSYPELFTQEATSAYFQQKCTANDWANGRSIFLRSGNKEMYVLINPRVDASITMTYPALNPGEGNYHILSQSLESEPSLNAQASKVTIPANCYVVVASTSISGVKGITTDADDLSVSTRRGGIELAGDTAARIYDLSGRMVYSGKAGTVSLPAGMYIVRAGSRSIKVMVP